jgi:hypothetical protein
MQLVSATYQVAVANKTNVSSMVMVSSCRFMRVSRWTRESAGAGEITPELAFMRDQVLFDKNLLDCKLKVSPVVEQSSVAVAAKPPGYLAPPAKNSA